MRRAGAAVFRAIVLGVVVGVAAVPAWADPAVPIPEGYHMEPYRGPVPDTVPGAGVVHTSELRALVAAGRAVPIDVLPAPRRPAAMRAGAPWLPQAHVAIPGSLWWPEAGVGGLAAEAEALMRRRLAGLAPGRMAVFYCHPDCWLSWNAARRAEAMGFSVAWYPDGIEGWQEAGLTTEAVLPDPLE